MNITVKDEYGRTLLEMPILAVLQMLAMLGGQDRHGRGVPGLAPGTVLRVEAAHSSYNKGGMVIAETITVPNPEDDRQLTTDFD